MRSVAAIFFALLFLSLAFAVGAVNDSVSTALDIVNGFYAEAESLVETVDEAKAAFVATAPEKKEKTLEDIRSIGMAKSPSRARYEQVREVVEGYMDGVISDIERLKSGPAKNKAALMDDIAAQLAALMSFNLKTLEDTLEMESYEKKGPKPVPLIDRERTPFDHPPDEPPGIWFR